MRASVLIIVFVAGSLWAQQRSDSTTYSYDVHGRRTSGLSTATITGKGQTSQTVRTTSVNGRDVPLEKVDEKVLEDGPRGRVIERTIQRYDQNGAPTPPERIRIEERPGAGGRSTTTTTYFESDINGRFQVRQRERTQATTTDTRKDATTVVERPNLNGGMSVAERRVITETSRDSGSTRDVTVYRRDMSGSFVPSNREVSETVETEGGSTTTTNRYNTANSDATMALADQTVTDVETRADGSRTTVVSIYGAAQPGRPGRGGSQDVFLREKLTTESRVERDGSVVETTGVQRVSLSDPNRLEPYQPVSETVCRGACLEQKPAGAEKEETASGNAAQGEAQETARNN